MKNNWNKIQTVNYVGVMFEASVDSYTLKIEDVFSTPRNNESWFLSFL